ncbi:hypothetical protein SAMN02745121_03754 [Nannocystis exedens]|uniref:DUF5689 domain-containing protein n=1 Tax=Nannocystis exedens TaxID=54 RepID=A0A1I1ZCW9_9BACT|nr:hypothetical protein [Nannocystis exedens]PCC75041.1 hypothetical protein NAEX_08144 [Nannocystis exedens]SFE29432.1 hypothetical protein SAMN02745121_03754 [Nannocystis exedens]
MRRLVPCTALCLFACNAFNNTTAGDDATATEGTAGTTDTPPTTTNQPTDGGGLQDTTIYDLQQDKVTPNTLVRVKDVVVVSPTKFSGSGAGTVFIQELDGGEYSGIQLYIYPDTATELMAQGKVPKPGDKLTVIGEYVEYKAMDDTGTETFSEINISLPDDIMITGTADAPTPPVVSPPDIANGGALTEVWESVVVTVENVDVTNADLGFGEFEVTGGLRIDDLFFLPEGGPKPPMGTTLTLTGPLLYNFGNFKLAPRSCDDYVGFECEGGSTTDTDTETTGPMGAVTIFDIQQGMVPEGNVVTVENVVVTSPLTFKKDGFFVQDPAGGEYSGIYVYINQNPDMLAVQPGDVVTINGLYTEFYDMSQITAGQAGDVIVTGTDAVPSPIVVAPADIATGGAMAENYESVLVSVENVTVAAEADMFGEWTIDDGLRLDDLFFATADWPKPMVGDTFTSITGPLVFSFENFKLAPRTAEDLAP